MDHSNKPIFYIFLLMPLFDAAQSSVLNFSALEKQIFQYIESHQDEYVETLKKWVEVESDSIQPQLRQEITKMMDIAAESLRALGANVTVVNLSSQQLLDGKNISLPPVILAELEKDPLKPTVCFYGHLDVMPAKKEDGWETEPYKLTEINGNLYGRGTTDNKGPVLAWINAVGAFKALHLDIPVNIKFLLEGMEEAGSIGLEDFLKKENKHFFSSVTYIVISDNTWLSTDQPALTYGSRGDTCFAVKVEGGKKDLHSGAVGGIIHEPMFDLIALLGSLVDSSGHILIPGIYNDVANLTDEEMEMYKKITFDVSEHKVSTGVNKFRYDTKEEILSHLWRYPSLSIHGIEGAFHEQGTKTVIPSRIIGKFSIRQVPYMNISTVEHQVKTYLKDVFDKLNSPNNLTVSMDVSSMPWVGNTSELQYKAAGKAIEKVFGKSPDMIQDGSTIPVARIFQDITKKNVIMFPIGAADDGEHSQKEKISRYNYINGTKVFASFLLEISKLHGQLQEASKGTHEVNKG